MKRIFIIPVLVFALFGCGGEKSKESEKTNSQNRRNSASNSAVNSNQASNGATSQIPKISEKSEPSSEINFKNSLPNGWEIVDPEKENPSGFEIEEGILKLKIPSGKDLYGENLTAPRLLKTVSGNFEIETRVKFLPTEDNQGAGLLIFRNDNNYLRLERGYGGAGGGENGIRFERREDETYESVAKQDKFPTAAPEVELKFRRLGKEFTAFWREAGKSEWIEVGKVSSDFPEILKVGLIGVSTADEITAEFAFIKLSPQLK